MTKTVKERLWTQEAADFIRKRGLIAPGDRVLAAVSGGPDSVAMLDILNRLRKELKFELMAAHLNHGLRGSQSDGDQRFVKQLATGMGLEFLSRKIDVAGLAKARKISMETAAREARKTFLEEEAEKHGCQRIATGHTRSDQAETVLMRLIRGGGTDGLGGIPLINGRFIRPLLGFSRRQILDYLACRRLSYRIDSSNKMKDAFRNRIRLELLPLLHQYNPKIEESLARTAEALAGDREVLSQAVSEAADSCVMSGKSELSIDLQILKGYNKGLQRNLIRWCCIRLLGPGRPPDFKSVERALNLAFAGRVGQRAILSGGLWARRGYRHLHLGPQNTGPGAQSKAGKNLKIPGSTIWGNWTIKCSIILVKKDKVAGARPQVAYFDRDQLAGQKLWVSSLKPGLKMRLFGSGGTRKIQDMLVDAKVPREERGQRPVVYAGNEPVWLAGIRRSDAAPITDRTKEAIRLELVKNDE